MTTRVFKGANVFMSRNLVPPELFDSLHDALKLNGAQVFLCCDPSRNSPNDYHVISSPDHEKFEDLRSKGCNLLGPQCVLSCAKEHRPLPKQGFTCCLAMDGVRLLASGFEMDEKAEIDKLVTSMGGVLQMKTSMDVSFVVVKNVLAAKYKWAANVLKKPIVTINWLHQCWKEHRVVPQESYRVFPFSGLTICVTRILADERKLMAKVIIENGGKYSAELTKKCTHLVCDAPEGDKYKVAKRWGHIHIITKKWFEQSVARRACLSEESYPVQGTSASTKIVRKVIVNSQDKSIGYSQCDPSSAGTASDPHCILYAEKAELDCETAISLSHSMPSTFQSDPVFAKEHREPPTAQLKNDSNFDGFVADDSQTEEDDLYLCDCRILLVGFDASDMRKLVSVVRRGGGSRYMSFNEKLTHIVVGTPSESEIKEIRNLVAFGVIFVVKTEWLEDCDRERKEVPVLRRHIAYDLFLPKDPICSGKRTLTSANEMKQGKPFVQPILPDNPAINKMSSKSATSLERGKELGCIRNGKISLIKDGSRVIQQQSRALVGKDNTHQQKDASHAMDCQNVSHVFAGKQFCFSASFPADQRTEIVEWINQGGGEVVEGQVEEEVHFIVECHGVVPSDASNGTSKCVSTHWIRSSLMDGCLLDVSSHILYSPLPCKVPFIAFKSFRFCVSQYDKKERLLLRNMCFILGVQFVEKLTKKVTHLLCKFAGGEKYEAACKWGTQPVTAEWIYECVKQNKVVGPGPFYPKEATSQERGVCTMTQYSTQAGGIISGETASQIPSHSQSLETLGTEPFILKSEELNNSRSSAVRMLSGEKASHIPSQSQSFRTLETEPFTRTNEELNNSSGSIKKARIFEADKRDLLSESHPTNGICQVTPTEDRIESAGEDTTTVRSQSQLFKAPETESFTRTNEELNNSSGCIKKARIVGKKDLLSESYQINDICHVIPMEDDKTANDGGDTTLVPDVASIIDLLEQTSKIHDQKSPAKSGPNRSLFTSDCAVLGQDHGEPQSAFALPKHWINRFDQKEDSNPPENGRRGDYDVFTDTQTESQVVSYVQDLSGMQIIIDRVRTRNSMT